MRVMFFFKIDGCSFVFRVFKTPPSMEKVGI
jgi:hypothetical protein